MAGIKTNIPAISRIVMNHTKKEDTGSSSLVSSLNDSDLPAIARIAMNKYTAPAVEQPSIEMPARRSSVTHRGQEAVDLNIVPEVRKDEYVSPYAQNADYAELSKYVSTEKKDEDKIKPTLYERIMGAATEWDQTHYTYDDPEYEYINKNQDVRENWKTRDYATKSYIVGGDSSWLDEMSDDEISDYNYVYHTQGKEAAAEFLEGLKKDLNKRQMDKYKETIQEETRKNPVGYSVASVLEGPLNTASLLGQVVDYAADGDIDPNAGYNRYAVGQKTIRETVPENWSAVGKFLYGTGMSIADNLYNMALSGAFGNLTGAMAEPLTLAIMSSSAAANHTLEALENGYSSTRALLQGAIAGGIEALTEKVSFETLLNPNAFADGTLKYILKNMAAEGSEEGVATLLNWVVDIFGDQISGQRLNEWARTYDQIAAENPDLSESEIKWKMIKTMAGQLALDAAGGALSGGVLAGGSSAVNLYSNTMMGRNMNRSMSIDDITNYVNDSYNEISNDTASSPYQINLNERAIDQLKNNGRVNNSTLGALAQNVDYTVADRQNAENIVDLALARINEGKTVNGSLMNELINNERAQTYLRDYGGMTELEGSYAEKASEVKRALNNVLQSYDESMEPMRNARRTAANNLETLYDFADTFGDEGSRTLKVMALEKGIENVPALARSYAQVYNAVKEDPDTDLNELSSKTQNTLKPQELDRVFKAAIQDRETDLRKTGLDYETKGESNGTEEGSQNLGDSEERNARLAESVSARNLAEWTEEIRAKRESARDRRESIQNNAAVRALEEVNPKEANIPNGLDTDEARTMRVLPENVWTVLGQDTYSFLNSLKDDGFNVIAWAGEAKVYDKMSDAGAAVRGFINGKTIGIRVDAELSPRQIAYHELFHDQVKTGSDIQKQMVNKLYEHYGEARVRATVRDYVDQYKWTNATDDEILNEILADSYAGIDIYDHLQSYEGATQYTETVRQMVNETGDANLTITNEDGVMASFSRENSDTERNSIKDAVRSVLPKLKQTGSVYNVTVNFKGNESAESFLARIYSDIGETVEREGYGTVQLPIRRLKKAKNYGLTPEEIRAYMAIPAVIKNGVEARTKKNFKQREYESTIFAALITIDGEERMMGVAVKKTTDNFYKIHRLLMPDGTVLKINEAELANTGGVADNDSLAQHSGPLLDTNISQEQQYGQAESIINPSNSSDIENKVENGEALTPQEESQYSLEHDQEFAEKAERYNTMKGSARFVKASVMKQAIAQREFVRGLLAKEGMAQYLPEDKMGKTSFGNASYGMSMEHSTICPRTLSMEAILDGVSENFGRPLTVEEAVKVSQLAWEYMDAPECAYCYVAMDRKAKREYRLNYLQSRDEVFRNLDAGMSEDEAYQTFLNGRKGTQPMSDRFNEWIRLRKNGADMVRMKDLASERAIQAAAKRGSGMASQIKDVEKYAQSASWAKKYVQYTAYNGEILKWSQDRINKLNAMYGLRLYSFSDFHPAFTLEDMQIVTDAAVRGLKVLAYTKEIDFARIMEPTGANINISVFAQTTRDQNGDFGMDAMQGADWEEAKALRQKSIENGTGVGITMVCVNDEQIDWALDQDWIDVVIPFHMVKTGAKVADYFGWENYTDMQGDRKLEDWTQGENERMIEPPVHQNNKDLYFKALKENHLSPRFAKWQNHENYMKLVNETRVREADTPTVQPKFNTDAVEGMIDTMVRQGGYYQHMQHLGLDEDTFEGVTENIADTYREKYGEPVQFSRDTAPEFYSKLENEVQNYKGDKLGAASVVSYLKGRGVKDEEIKWTGIATFLEGKKSVQKSELLQYIRDNQIEIEEEELGEGVDTNIYGEYVRAKEDLENEAWNAALGMDDHIMEIQIDEDDTLWKAYGVYDDGSLTEEPLATKETKGTNWGDYITPGGYNYREILYKIPGSTYINEAMKTHWKGTAGVLAHARIQDFETGDGRILFVDEIQSDWHNAGEKGGYAESETEITEKRVALEQQLEALNKEYNDLKAPVTYKEWQEAEAMANVFSSGVYDKVLSEFREYYDTHGLKDIPGNEWVIEGDLRERMLKAGEEYQRLTGEAEKKRIAYRDWDTKRGEIAVQIRQTRRKLDTLRSGNTSVPDAPFRNGTYIQYVLKDLLRKAAEGGYDYLAWTTGQMQENRWSSQYAEGYRIEYDQDIPKFLSKYGKQWGAKLTQLALDENAADVAEYKEDFDEFFHLMMDYDPDIGYDELAQGIGRLYDNLPFVDEDVAEMFSEEFIDRVSYLADRLDEAYRNGLINEDILENGVVGDVPAIPITDAMRESVLYEGQPRFSRDLPANADETAQKVVENLYKKASLYDMSAKYGRKSAAYTDERINREIEMSYATGSTQKDYAQDYIAFIRPEEFIQATSSPLWRNGLYQDVATRAEEAGRESMLDVEVLTNERQSMYLNIETGEDGRTRITGHEGRHRMIGLEQEGYRYVPVIIHPSAYGYPDGQDRYNTKPIDMLYLDGQEFSSGKGSSFVVHDIIPLSVNYADIAREVFAGGKNVTRFSRETSETETEKYLKGQNRQLQRDLDDITKRYEHFKDQLTRTKVRTATEKSAYRIAKNILADYGSGADTRLIREGIVKASEALLNVSEDMSAEELQSNMKQILMPYAADVVSSSYGLMNEEEVKVQREIRNTLRNGSGIVVTDHMKSDIPDWAQFRKAQFGNMKLVSGAKTNVHDVYADLREQFGANYFPEDIINESDMLQHIADVMADLAAVWDNPYTYGGKDAAEAVEACANDMLMELVNNVEEKLPTFADKEQAKLDKARKEAIDAKDKALARVREQRDEALKRQAEHYQDRIKSMYDQRKMYELRSQIRKKVNDLGAKLTRPTDKQHVPQALQIAVIDVLKQVNTGSAFDWARPYDGTKTEQGAGIPTRKTSAFLRLKDQLSEIRDRIVVDQDLFDSEEGSGILSELALFPETSIDKLNVEELQKVMIVLRSCENAIQTWNKMFNASKYAEISEASEAIFMENMDKKGRPEYARPIEMTVNLVNVDMLPPEAYFNRLGNSGKALFKMLRQSQDQNIRILKEAQDFSKENGLYDLKLKDYEKKLLTVKFGNRNVQMTKAQLMELYILNKRDASRAHIQVGGILPEPVNEGLSLKKVTYNEPVRNVTQDDIAAAMSNLTAEDIRIAEAMQTFVSTVMTAHGNEASMRVYGYEKFGEDNYWPIRVNEQDLKTELGAVRVRARSVSSKGFTNAVKPNAKQSVMIGSIFDTFNDHVAEMANYSAWLATMEDMKRIYNFTEKDREGAIEVSTKYTIQNVFGQKGTKYFEKLMQDLSNGTVSEQAYFGGLMGKFKAAAVGSNLRVIVQQPTAIFRAMDMISPKYLAEGILKFSQGAKKAIEKAPIAQWKDWGYFDINTGRSTKNILFENSTTLDRVQNVLMSGAGKADSVAWGALYSAVEAETKALHPELDARSKAFDEVVVERFEDIIDHSQVVDGVLQRSALMRSENAIDKMATSFMGEPTKQFNMLASAIYDYRNGKGDKKQAGRYVARTAAAMLFAGVLNAAVQSIMDAVRNDDPEKDYWEKFLEKFTGEEATFGAFFSSNVGDLVNPLQYIPYAKDIVSIAQGYEVERMDVSLINDLYTDAKSLVNAFNGKGKYSLVNNIMNFTNTVAKFFGLSTGNVKRDVAGLLNTFAQNTGSYMMMYRMAKFTYNMNQSTNKGRFVSILAEAYKNDREAYDLILKDLVKEDRFATTTMTTYEWIRKRLKEKHEIEIPKE